MSMHGQVSLPGGSLPEDVGRSSPLPTPGSGPRIHRVEAVVNAASGGVGAGAAQALGRILASHGLSAHVADVRPRDIAAATQAAVQARPDLLVVLAGDGTAALAARLAGLDGPLIAPLPGGTMNMLPHALYGPVNWRQALVAAVSRGVEQVVSGGEIGGRTFYVAAILGSAALWAEAREALRAGRPRLAWARARLALARAFSRDLQYALQADAPQKARALMLLCPTPSRSGAAQGALEAAALDPHDTAEVLRLGLNAVAGRWRADPSVRTTACSFGRAWSRGRLPAVLDGEPCRLERSVNFRFRPVAFRALAPPTLAAGASLTRDPGAAASRLRLA